MAHVRIIVLGVLFLLAIPIGLEFVIYDTPYPFGQLRQLPGFWLSWGSSSGVSFVAMVVVACATCLLHRQWPWPSDVLTRLMLQVAIGVLIPLAIVVAWNAGFFYRSGATLHLETYFESEFWLTLILLVILNGVCCLVFILLEDRKIKEKGVQVIDGEPPTLVAISPVVLLAEKIGINVANLVSNAAYIEVSGRTCMVYRTDGGTEAYAITMDEMEKAVTGTSLCRIHRKYIVNGQSIAEVKKNLTKHVCTIHLAKPYEKTQLNVGPRYLNMFLKWWETESG